MTKTLDWRNLGVMKRGQGPEDIADFRRKLAERKNETTLEGLFRLARVLNELALSRRRAQSGDAWVRASHTALLPHIDLEGTRLTTLADRLGITKQAIGQLVDELEQQGMLERVADPEDGRAKRVRFSAKGRQGLLEGLELLRDLETELSAHLGARRWKEFRSTVFELLAHLPAVREPDTDR